MENDPPFQDDQLGDYFHRFGGIYTRPSVGPGHRELDGLDQSGPGAAAGERAERVDGALAEQAGAVQPPIRTPDPGGYAFSGAPRRTILL